MESDDRKLNGGGGAVTEDSGPDTGEAGKGPEGGGPEPEGRGAEAASEPGDGHRQETGQPPHESLEQVTLCQVRLRPEAYPVTYLVGDLELTEGEWVVVPTEHGREVGQVVKRPYRASLSQDKLPQRVERLATTSEIEDYYRNLERERSAWQTCQRLCDSLGLNMKLVRVERFFDGSKIIFYYSADGRIDFRELVKGLVKELRMRVEMRQIGIRHEAKMIGGIGCCGRELCCASFLKGFDPISIKMAKAQNLPLNPSKISGFCGRLLCCLTFEYDTYRELSQDMPALGKACKTPDGQGKVIRHNIFKQAVTVMMPDGSFVEYQIEDLTGKPGAEGQRPAPSPSEGSEAGPAGAQGQKQDSETGDKGPSGGQAEGGAEQKRAKQAKAKAQKGKKRGSGQKKGKQQAQSSKRRRRSKAKKRNGREPNGTGRGTQNKGQNNRNNQSKGEKRE